MVVRLSRGNHMDREQKYFLDWIDAIRKQAEHSGVCLPELKLTFLTTKSRKLELEDQASESTI